MTGIVQLSDHIQAKGGRGQLTMSSREIAELLGSRHDNVKVTVQRLSERGIIGSPAMQEFRNINGVAGSEYLLDKRSSLIVVAQLSPEFTARVVDRWQELEAKIAQPQAIPTTAEAFAHAFTMLAQTERVQAQQAQAIAALEATMARVETAQVVLSARPANAEAISHIRARIGKVFGLSASVIDEVMRQSPYAPKPAGMVRNDHVDADGALYAVYWQKDVTKTFERFVGECAAVTPLMFTHPFIEGRFRYARATGAA